MSDSRLFFWMRALHLAVGGLALIQSVGFLFEVYLSTESLYRKPLFWAQIALATSEIIAALLFLIPRTFVVGAWALVTVFLLAAALHVAHGEFNVGGLLVYAVAVLSVKTFRDLQKEESR